MQKGQGLILVIVGILVAGLIAAGAYYLGRSNSSKSSQVPVVTSPTPQSAASPAPATDASREPTGSAETANWKTYTNGQVTFSYPSSWEVLTEVPYEYRTIKFDITKEDWDKDYLRSKMFASTCRGPILRNTEVKSTIIAVDVSEGSDGAWCFSLGDFTKTYDRIITTLGNPYNIKVSKWTMGDYLYPVTQDNSGKKYSPEWKGDLLESYFFTLGNKHVAVALVYQNLQDASAEPVFDRLLSTFKFSQ